MVNTYELTSNKYFLGVWRQQAKMVQPCQSLEDRGGQLTEAGKKRTRQTENENTDVSVKRVIM